MKKIFAILLVGVLLLSLFACNLFKPEEKDIKFTNFPTLSYLYNTSDSHKAIGEYLAAALANVGITMNLSNQEWGTFLETRKNGDYFVARNGWVADYSDPICFLDMWTSNSGNNDVQFGKGAHANLKMYNLDLTDLGYNIKVENGTWAETYDVLISTIKSETNNEKRYALMHKAEDMLMATGCITPLYYYTDLYMIDESVKGFYSNPLGYKYFMYTSIAGKDYINVCLASEPGTLDPALNSAVDGATMLAHLFAGLAKWSMDDSGKLVIEADLAETLPEGVVNTDGTVTYTYKLRENLKWSNGAALTAQDFVDSWNRAASAELAADYGYMFETIKGYDAVANGEEGAKLAVEATDERTLVVTLSNAVAYWNELLAFPTYFPIYGATDVDAATIEAYEEQMKEYEEEVKKDPDLLPPAYPTYKGDKWSTEPSTYVCNGPYTMKAWAHNSLITLEKNDNFYAADKVTMKTINCYLSDDANNMLTSFKNGDWQLIDDVPTNEIASLKKDYANEFVVAGQIGTYYVCWNINKNLLPADSTLTGVEAEKAQQEIRIALGLLFDRNYIVNDVAQGGEVPASSFVAMGMTNPDGTEFYKTANSTTDSFDGYYDVSDEAFEGNVAAAKEVLKKYYTYEEVDA